MNGSGQLRYYCGRWNRGPWWVRFWDLLHGRRSVYRCELEKNHPLTVLRAAREKWITIDHWYDVGRRKGRVISKVVRNEPYLLKVPAWEWGHRFRWNRYEAR